MNKDEKIKINQSKQTSSASKVNQQTIKSKKFIPGKSGTLQNKLIERLKSNEEAQIESKISKTVKPRSSLSKRPASSHKHIESSNSNTNGNFNLATNMNRHLSVSTPGTSTNENVKSQQQIKQIIHTVFSHSKKIQNYMSEKNLDQNQVLQSLTNNQLFVLSLVTMTTNKTPQQISKYIERSCIHKLDRMISIQNQKKICENIEAKIQKLINQRIKALSHY